MICVHCMAPTRGRWSGDGEGEAICLACARSAMDHGHAHSHDTAEDCQSTWTGNNVVRVDCASPCQRCEVAEGEADSCWDCSCPECRRLQREWHRDNPRCPECDSLACCGPCDAASWRA